MFNNRLIFHVVNSPSKHNNESTSNYDYEDYQQKQYFIHLDGYGGKGSKNAITFGEKELIVKLENVKD